MNSQNDTIVVVNARKAVSVELTSKRALGFSINGFDVKTKTIYTKTPDGKIIDVSTSMRGRYSERKK